MEAKIVGGGGPQLSFFESWAPLRLTAQHEAARPITYHHWLDHTRCSDMEHLVLAFIEATGDNPRL